MPDALGLLIWFNLGLLIVLMLRSVWHRTSCPSGAYTLWLLPLLLVIGAALPLAPEVRVLQVTALPVLAEPIQTTVADLSRFSWWAFAECWLPRISAMGSLVLALLMVRQHLTFRRGLANSQSFVDVRCPELPIRRAAFGPALIGVTNPMLILPHDFESRFTPRQQTLAITHEVAHWRSGDVPIRTLAWAMVVLQWWNPLAWWSLARFIEDQELANDARVLSACPGSEHDYAGALVKSFSVPMPPLACAMHPTHPLIWRVSMLKSHSTHRVARRWMNLLTGMMLLSIAGLAIALDPTPEQTPAEPFTVAMDVQIDEGSKSSFAVAGPAGESMAASIDADGSNVLLALTVKPTETAGHVLVETSIHRDGKLVAEPALQVAINGEGRIQAGTEVDGRFEGVRVDLKVSEGLPQQADAEPAQPAKLRFAEAPAWQSGVSWLNNDPSADGC